MFQLLVKVPAYRKIFRSLFLARIARKIITLRSKSNFMNKCYTESTEALGNKLDSGTEYLEKKLKFSSLNNLSRNTVIINYFMKFGTLYLLEREGLSSNEKIPTVIKNFFINFFKDYKKIG